MSIDHSCHHEVRSIDCVPSREYTRPDILVLDIAVPLAITINAFSMAKPHRRVLKRRRKIPKSCKPR